MRKTSFLALAAGAAIAGLAAAGSARSATQATVIELTQTACQFVEVEGVDHGYASTGADDCNVINGASGEERQAEAETLRLAPGDYVFRVTNQNVPYQLGFWLRGDGLLNRATLPSVSGGGLHEGQTRDYTVSLEPGEYVFSCPLNPTLDYKLVVEG